MRQERSRCHAVFAALTLAGVSLLAVGPAPAAPKGSPWGASYFPNVPLVTQDGQSVRFYDDLLKGKAVAINLIYTQCKDTCPLETARLVQVQRLLGDRVGTDIFFYSISIDPKRDTPEVLKAYAEKFGVGPGWLFLTGKEEDIALVSKKLGLSSIQDSASRDGHSPSLMIGNEPTGQWMRNSAVDNPRFLATKISSLMGWRNDQPGRSYAEAVVPTTPDMEAYLFQSRCGSCHTIGKGEGVGPDLVGVTTRRDRAWIARYLKAPDRMLAEKDPIAVALFAKYKNVRMPNLRLADGEVDALIKYLEAQSAALQPAKGQELADPAMSGSKQGSPPSRGNIEWRNEK